MLRRVTPLVLVLGAIAACGARSALDDFGASSQGGAGGTSSASSNAPSSSSSSSSVMSSANAGGATSSSTGGGKPFSCLSITGAPTRVPFETALAVGSPMLVVPAGSTTSVALVAGLAPPFPPLGVPAEVAVTRVDAWGDWPPAIAAMTPIATVTQKSRFAISTSTDDDAFALLVDVFDTPTTPGGLEAAVDASTDGTATFTSISTEHQDPLFIATTDVGVAFASQKTDAQGAGYSHVEAFGQVVEHAACGTELAGAALSSGDHLLFALSSQDTQGGCASSPAPADARRVGISLASANGISQTEAYGPLYPNYSAISALAWSPKSTGGWLFERSIVTNDADAAIVEGSILDDGHGDLPPTKVPVAVSDGLAMAPWRGDDVFGVSDAGSLPEGVVRSFVYHRATSGDDQTDVVDITPQGLILGEFAAVADATEKQWLIAWTERESDGTFALWVARIACDA